MLRKIIFIFAILLSLAVSAQKVNYRVVFDNWIKKYNQTPNWGMGEFKVSRVSVNAKSKTCVVTFHANVGDIPFREELVKQMTHEADSIMRKYSRTKYKVKLMMGGKEIKNLIPNYYISKETNYDKTKIPKTKTAQKSVVKNNSLPYDITKGLQSRNIALWHSHGWTYNSTSGRWEWQRCRLFNIVEDKFIMSFVLPYLTPMLENAGANVLLPRERDIQINEVIVDNDTIRDGSIYQEIGEQSAFRSGGNAGFAWLRNEYYEKENPFADGTFRTFTSSTEESSKIVWTPNIPESGYYWVSIAYKTVNKSTTDAQYTVYHTGGTTEYSVNQTMGGSTWIYLGQFYFEKGINPDLGKVVLSNKSSKNGQVISADAVRFGGGMGNIVRPYVNDITLINPNKKDIKGADLPTKDSIIVENFKLTKTDSVLIMKDSTELYLNDSTELFINPSDTVEYVVVDEEEKRTKIEDSLKVVNKYIIPQVSGKPRYLEAGRYWMQWAGIPHRIYASSDKKKDNIDDYSGRPLWANYLAYGSDLAKDSLGLSIPISLVAAIHSDAGTRNNDSIIGTLGIYTSRSKTKKTKYPNGISRYASRDLTDIVLTEICNDIQKVFEPKWTRRGMWDRPYAESRAPELPTTLLEILSHQNFADMRYGNDPNFKFLVSRAIYKGFVKFIATQNNVPYIIQPLPVSHVASRLIDSNTVMISWRAVNDSIEATATPTGYVVYTRKGNGGFDNGVYTKDNYIKLHIKEDQIYSYKVIAVNDGGASMPSEIVSAYSSSTNDTQVLIINGFTRVSAGGWFDEGNFSGFIDHKGLGVADKYDLSYVGSQKEFRKGMKWINDDDPGHGDSYSTFDNTYIAGNSFDFCYKHGKSIAKAGYSYSSSSLAAIEDGDINIGNYKILDIILGEQKSTIVGTGYSGVKYKTFTTKLQDKLTYFTDKGGSLFVSGAYIGSDLTTKSDTIFAEKTLKFSPHCDKASDAGNIVGTRAFKTKFEFETKLNSENYSVESPDAIKPAEGSSIILRYKENNNIAAIAYQNYNNVICMGFPFEAIKEESSRDEFMKQILKYLDYKNNNSRIINSNAKVLNLKSKKQPKLTPVSTKTNTTKQQTSSSSLFKRSTKL